MEKDKTSIRELVLQLTKPFGTCSANKIIANDLIYSCYRKDIVDDKVLLKLIRKSMFSRKIRYLIPDILSFIHEKSITDSVLQCCLHYPGRFKSTLLIQLAHMWLRPDQLEKINDYIDTPEAFCKLFGIYAADQSYSAEYFSRFLSNNMHFVRQVNCMEQLETHKISISQEKHTILNELFDT